MSTLLFEDNFDGYELDLTKWSVCPEQPRQGASFWKKENVSLDGSGHRALAFTDSSAPDCIFTGGIRSKGKFERKFGYFEASIRFPVLRGAWGAFWLMGDTVFHVDDSGRDGTEIDIVESIRNDQGLCNSALHWDGYKPEHHKMSEHPHPDTNIYDGRFHTFALDWSETEYAFYIDGKELWRTTDGGVCQAPLYLKLTTEAAPWAGTVDRSLLPLRMLVDYVRVWDSKPMECDK